MMRIKIDNVQTLNCLLDEEISLYVESSLCAQTEDQRQDVKMDKVIKNETEIIKYNRMGNVNVNDDNVYSPLTLKPEYLKDKAIQINEHENVQYNRTNISEEDNEICKETKADDTTETVVPKTNNSTSNGKSRRSSRLSANNKKKNLKKVCNIGKIVKQKTSKKSNRPIQSRKSDNPLMMLHKKDENEVYYKSLFPSFGYINHNDNISEKNMLHYRIINQQGLHQYNIDNRNTLQYLDHLNYQANFMNINPWMIASSGQNMILNNITNMQNNAAQGIINDRQYNTPVDYNWKWNGNPYTYSSINSTDPYKSLPIENNDYCLCNTCTNYKRNNTYSGMESLPRTNATFQPMFHNSTTNNISLTDTSNNTLNTSMSLYNSLSNYQQLQTDYNYKQLFYKTFNTVNYMNNSGCEVTSIVKENTMPPLNNWHHINRSTCNNNFNVPLNAASTSNVLSSPVHADNTKAHLSNYYNTGMEEANVSTGQYSEKDNPHLYVVPIFENSSSVADIHALDSHKSTNTLSQNSTGTTNTENNVATNFLPETDTANVCEEFPSDMGTKKKDWFSEVFDTIYKDDF